jgi:hypothetical protein
MVLLTGSRRIRVPVAAKIALVSAGAAWLSGDPKLAAYTVSSRHLVPVIVLRTWGMAGLTAATFRSE